ncbi:MAG: hypothetical protein ACXWIU_09500 [Limisphaerales bacterium]
MKTKTANWLTHNPGANRNEFARKLRKLDRNFAQSRDIHEDRGERQIKTTREKFLPRHRT